MTLRRHDVGINVLSPGQVAVFLAATASSFVNGVELFVDGGLAQV